MTCIQNSLQRFLIPQGSKLDLREGVEFIKSSQVLPSRWKELTTLRKGNKENAAWPITPEEVATGYFGAINPVILQRYVWWFLTQHFGYRVKDEYGDVIEKRISVSK